MLLFLTECFILTNKVARKKVEGINLGRPKEVKLDNGTVYLQDFEPEVSAALAEHVKNFVYVAPGTIPPPKAVNPLDLTEKAIGTRIDKASRKAQFVTVVYNGETGEAKVEAVTECDGLRDASVRFKIAAGNLNFV